MVYAVFDLKNDPEDYINLTQESLEHFMSKSPKIIRSVRNNKSPIIMNSNHISKVNRYMHISEKELLRRAEVIQSNTIFKKTVEKILEKQASEKEEFISQEDINYEETIYHAFSTNYEKIVMEEFHLSPWENKYKVANKFKDERNYYFAERLIYEEKPSLLPKDNFNKLIHIAKQIFIYNNEKWNTIPKAYKDIDDLRNKYEEEKDENILERLNDLNNLIEDIEKYYRCDAINFINKDLNL